MWIIDLNDSAVSIHDEKGLRAASAGYAILEEPLITGTAAVARSRTQPRLANSTFWQRLSQSALPVTAPRARTAADLAYAHLHGLVRQAGGEQHDPTPREAVLLVPATMDRTQLALLLGVARQCPLRVGAIVERTIAALASSAVALPCIHIDSFLHHALLTVVDADGDALRSVRTIEVPETGSATVSDAFVHAIAARFVRETRFDPLHQAATEQRLFDHLGIYLRGLEQADEVVVECPHGGRTHSLSLTRRALAETAEPHYAALARVLVDLQREYRGATVVATERMRLLPGLNDYLSSRGIVADSIDDHAAGTMAFTTLAALAANGDSVRFINRLPRTRTAEAPSGRATGARHSLHPSHLLDGHRLYGIDDRALIAGFGTPHPGRWLSLGDGSSRLAFSVVQSAQRVLLLPETDADVFVNGQPARTNTALSVGDEISVAQSESRLRVVGTTDVA